MKTAIIHGCYNTTNFGDLLLLELVAKYLKDKWNIESETLRLPKNISLEYCNVTSSFFRSLSPDHVIYGGGGYLHDGEGDKVATKRLLRYTIPAKIWTYQKIPYAIIGPGGGPKAYSIGAKRIKWLCTYARNISFRDTITTNFVRDLGVSRPDIITTSDIALTVKASDIPTALKLDLNKIINNKNIGKKVVGVHLEKIYEDQKKFHSFCQLEFLSDTEFLKKFHLVFFYDYKSENTELVNNSLNSIPGLSYTLIPRMNHWTTVDLLRQCDAIITTKLHVSIVSAAFGVPVFGYSFHEKTSRFFKEIGRGEYQKMWSDNMDCINDWMIQLKNGDVNAWNLSREHIELAKKSARVNFSVIDDYIERR